MDEQLGDKLDLMLDKMEKLYNALPPEKKKKADNMLMNFIDDLEAGFSELLNETETGI